MQNIKNFFYRHGFLFISVFAIFYPAILTLEVKAFSQGLVTVDQFIIKSLLGFLLLSSINIVACLICDALEYLLEKVIIEYRDFKNQI